jgi:hypothetical protein
MDDLRARPPPWHDWRILITEGSWAGRDIDGAHGARGPSERSDASITVPNATLSSLPRSISDHTSLLACLSTSIPKSSVSAMKTAVFGTNLSFRPFCLLGDLGIMCLTRPAGS